jgi:TP901 family phage tail tape measure protein
MAEATLTIQIKTKDLKRINDLLRMLETLGGDVRRLERRVGGITERMESFGRSLTRNKERAKALSGALDRNAQSNIELRRAVAGLVVEMKEANMWASKRIRAAQEERRQAYQLRTAYSRVIAAHERTIEKLKEKGRISRRERQAIRERIRLLQQEMRTAMEHGNVLGQQISRMKQLERSYNRLTEGVNRLEKSKKSLLIRYSNLVLRIAALAGGVYLLQKAFSVLGRAVTWLIESGREFEKRLADIKGVSGATTEEMENMRLEMKKIAETMPVTLTECAEAAYFLASAGWKAEEVTAALKDVVIGAVALMEDLTKTTEVVVTMLGAYGLEGKHAAVITEALTETISASQATLDRLKLSLGYVAPMAAATGVSIWELTGALGKLEDAGIRGERAGTYLRAMLSKLLAPSDEARKVLMKVGLTVADLDPRFGGLIGVLKRLRDANLSTRDAIEIFNREGYLAYQVLIKQIDAMEKFIEESGKATKVTERYAEAQKTLDAQLKRLEAAWSSFREDLYRMMLPVLLILTRMLRQFIADLDPAVLGRRLEILGKNLIDAAEGMFYLLKALDRAERFLRRFVTETMFAEAWINSLDKNTKVLAQTLVRAGTSYHDFARSVRETYERMEDQGKAFRIVSAEAESYLWEIVGAGNASEKLAEILGALNVKLQGTEKQEEIVKKAAEALASHFVVLNRISGDLIKNTEASTNAGKRNAEMSQWWREEIKKIIKEIQEETATLMKQEEKIIKTGEAQVKYQARLKSIRDHIKALQDVEKDEITVHLGLQETIADLIAEWKGLLETVEKKGPKALQQTDKAFQDLEDRTLKGVFRMREFYEQYVEIVTSRGGILAKTLVEQHESTVKQIEELLGRLLEVQSIQETERVKLREMADRAIENQTLQLIEKLVEIYAKGTRDILPIIEEYTSKILENNEVITRSHLQVLAIWKQLYEQTLTDITATEEDRILMRERYAEKFIELVGIENEAERNRATEELVRFLELCARKEELKEHEVQERERLEAWLLSMLDKYRKIELKRFIETQKKKKKELTEHQKFVVNQIVELSKAVGAYFAYRMQSETEAKKHAIRAGYEILKATLEYLQKMLAAELAVAIAKEQYWRAAKLAAAIAGLELIKTGARLMMEKEIARIEEEERRKEEARAREREEEERRFKEATEGRLEAIMKQHEWNMKMATTDQERLRIMDETRQKLAELYEKSRAMGASEEFLEKVSEKILANLEKTMEYVAKTGGEFTAWEDRLREIERRRIELPVEIDLEAAERKFQTWLEEQREVTVTPEIRPIAFNFSFAFEGIIPADSEFWEELMETRIAPAMRQTSLNILGGR